MDARAQEPGDSALDRAAAALAAAGRVVVSSGAGISKESGIPTFREAQTGLWARYDPHELATPDAFRRNPDLVWQWYRMRRRLAEGAAPNPGHHAVAALESLLPHVIVITQNVDGLHVAAGSQNVLELHGSLRRHKCAAACRGEPTVIPAGAFDAEADDAPPCPHCGAPLRPDVVWFGEMLPPGVLDRAHAATAACDVMLVVGTSGIVQPAASLSLVARRAGATVIEVNPAPTEISDAAHVTLRGPSGVVLPQLVEAVRARLNP